MIIKAENIKIYQYQSEDEIIQIRETLTLE